MCALSVGQLQAVVIREEAEQAATADTMEKRDLPEPGGDGLAGLQRDPGHGPWGSFSL